MSIPERFYCFQNHIFRVKSTKIAFFEYHFCGKVRSGCTGALSNHFIPYTLQGWESIMSIPDRYDFFQNDIFRVRSAKMVFF